MSAGRFFLLVPVSNMNAVVTTAKRNLHKEAYFNSKRAEIPVVIFSKINKAVYGKF